MFVRSFIEVVVVFDYVTHIFVYVYVCSYITRRPIWISRCPRGVIVKAMDCGIVVREFVLQSRYYVHFRANTLGKGMNTLILPAMS